MRSKMRENVIHQTVTVISQSKETHHLVSISS